MTTPTTLPAAEHWPYEALTPEELETFVRDQRVTEIVLGVPDVHGRLQGKVFNPSVFLDRMAHGAEMCSYILATDPDRTPLDGFDSAGWEQGFGDFLVKPDPGTAWILPTRPESALFLGTPVHDDGTPVEVAPRRMLTRQLERLRELGYLARIGVESEFLLCTKQQASLSPVWEGSLDYSLNPPPKVRTFFGDLGNVLNDAGIGHEAMKAEGAPGQVEVTFAYTDALNACDDYTLFRHMAAEIAGTGLAPVFMAAPETGVGSGLHLHVSLWSEHGEPCFVHHRGQDLSPLMDHAIAGLIGALPHLGVLYAPYVNSYKRYRPHSFAPLRYNWGIDHRGCAVRLAGHGERARLEVRLAGADATVYLAAAACIASIVYGIEEKLAAPLACGGDAYQDESSMPLPGDLGEALQQFDGSPVADRLLGKDVVRHYARLARAELLYHRRQVTDVERQRGIR
ncbi:glutamine synthetase family protein [Streptomyces cylindrosporus]|uniref:Glutamine synthetase family protein n=1 Tax=Streptomyces cylindrosporus TaxID=2927583 RepID=A0ABS9YC06_9ACTN|nr:glutamine synthetase family protein [Streptomyces cylindrosporus]MCI3273436.1 glutamine synthetase family protein [Streptomyces cylindrosporus]